MLGSTLDFVDAFDFELATFPDSLAASFGMTPSSASASHACASISNQMRNLFSGSQISVISGRL